MMCTYLLLRYIFYARHNIATIDVVIHESTLAFSHHGKHIESGSSTADDSNDDDDDDENTGKYDASSSSSILSSST